MKQHNLMVLGSMDAFMGIVRAAKARGYYVVCCDGYDHGDAKKIADARYTIDVRETEAIAEVCRKEQVDGIITSFSDLLAECMVNIADAAGLPCYSTPDRFRYLREKPLMKQMFAELGIPCAESVKVFRDSLESDIAKVGFPCVVKPANGYGSRGIYVLESLEELTERFDEVLSYSNCDHILAEKLLHGHEFNMMNWVMDGQVQVLGIADREKIQKDAKSIPDVSRVAYPSRLADKVCEEARAIAGKIAEYVGIDCGPISLQFFYDESEGIRVIEAAGRLFGYEHELVELASGFSIDEMLLDYLYDRDSLRKRLAAHSPFYAACSAGLYFHGREGVIAEQTAAELAAAEDGVRDALFFYEPGQTITHGPGSMPYVVRYYITAPEREALDELSTRLFEQVKVLDLTGANLLYPARIAEY